LREPLILSRYKNHSIDIIVDRVMLKDDSRLFEAVENALEYSKGLVTVIFREGDLKKEHKKLFFLVYGLVQKIIFLFLR